MALSHGKVTPKSDMSYIKGELSIGDEEESEGWDNGLLRTIYLPHSCDEWVIGGRAEAEALIEDIRELLDKHFAGKEV